MQSRSKWGWWTALVTMAVLGPNGVAGSAGRGDVAGRATQATVDARGDVTDVRRKQLRSDALEAPVPERVTVECPNILPVRANALMTSQNPGWSLRPGAKLTLKNGDVFNVGPNGSMVSEVVCRFTLTDEAYGAVLVAHKVHSTGASFWCEPDGPKPVDRVISHSK